MIVPESAAVNNPPELTFPALIRLPLPDPHACICEDAGTHARSSALPRCVPLTQGCFAVVDAQDYEWAKQRKWTCSKGGVVHKRAYATNSVKVKDQTTTKRMHREILSRKIGRPLLPAPQELTDHRDGDGLNNTRANLRLCTNKDNVRNQCCRKGGSSRFRGVEWCSRKGKWLARIGVEQRLIRIGLFEDEESAARAYDWYAVHYFWEFARTNFSEISPPNPDSGRSIYSHRLRRLGLRKGASTKYSSLYRGVCWSKAVAKWRAAITLPTGRCRFLGHFPDELSGALAYDRATVEFGVPEKRTFLEGGRS